jgi:tetratricopeptide (TPR) repeat protein
VLVCTSVWGEPAKDKGKPNPLGGRIDPPAARAERVLEDLPATRFTDRPVITYVTQGGPKAGETLFALQVQPKLPERPALPVDYLVMVDFSASQAGAPLASARRATDNLVSKLAERKGDDRVSIWTLSIDRPTFTRSLTKGFVKADAAIVKEASKQLKSDEYPAGDTDLKYGVSQAIQSFDNREGRQRVIVFMGDGMSTNSPLTAAERGRLCDQLVAKEITFLSVPLGRDLDPTNLHGLATGSGGTVVRLQAGDQPADLVDQLFKAAAVPVLYPRKFDLPAAAEYFPVKLPPVRSDAPLLVVGRLKDKKADKLTYTLDGSVVGKDVHATGDAPVPVAEVENFFLKGMVEQWAQGDRPQMPSPFRADRALAFSFDRARLAREELLTQGQWAIKQNQFDDAAKLFAEARDLDPADGEAAAGAKIAQMLGKGSITKKQLHEQLAQAGDNPKLRAERLQMLAQADAEEKKAAEPVPGPVVQPPAGRDNFLDKSRGLMTVEEQRIGEVVSEVEREARRVLDTDPDRAREIVKRTLASVRDNPGLGERAKEALVNRLTDTLQGVDRQGAGIKRRLEERMRLAADARRRINQDENRARGEEQLQRRIAEFNNLMNKGREDLAYQEILVMQQDAIARGAQIVPEMVAGYDMGLTATHLREVTELRRASEERFLLAMLQVEKSHVPFPDEPPVQFPPTATWRRINELRKGIYDSVGLGEDNPKEALKRQNSLERKINQDKVDGLPLKDVVDILNDRYDLNLIVAENAFATVGLPKVMEQPVTLPKMVNVSISTVLRMLCNQLRGETGYGGTYLIRKDLVEITSTYHAAAEKTIRAYPVADLVISIPNSINQQALNQSINALGQVTNINNPLGLPPGQLGIGGINLGIGGVNLGALGGANLGALGGALGALGGALGALGQAAGVGGLNFGFQGANVGNNQFGNLGGQFGLQGADQSQKLMELIVDTVGLPGEWRPLRRNNDPLTNPNPGPGPGAEPPDANGTFKPELLNSLGYYSPARALIIRGSSKIHTRQGEINIGGPNANPGMTKLDDKRPGVDVAAKDKPAGPAQVAGVKDQRDKKQVDPKTAWQEVLAQGVKNPRAIIETADCLIENKKYDHAVEFLKAALREGIVDQPWAFEALGVALQMTDASTDEVERALVSAVDLTPKDPQAYLKTARALNNLKDHKLALSFCRQAAALQPNSSDSYSAAMAMAHDSKDSEAMAWAAGKLLAQDWPLENENLHSTAQDQLDELSALLKKEKRQAEADQMVASVQQSRERDLVIRLRWQGNADLDLQVKEPIGTVCSFQQRQTAGGGTLMGDTLSDTTSETYVAAQAFSGTYEVKVVRVYGQPLNSSAIVEVVRHEGTPQQKIERHKLTIDTSNTLRVTLDDGHRTTAASVPPPSVRQRPEGEEAPAQENVLAQLRMMTNPVYGEVRGESKGVRGGFTGASVEQPKAKPASKPTPEATLINNKVSSFVKDALNVSNQITIRGARPVDANPIIPGN